MDDKPIMERPSPVRDLETKAMQAYREKYPDGPPWQELDLSTRKMWFGWVEDQLGGTHG